MLGRLCNVPTSTLKYLVRCVILNIGTVDIGYDLALIFFINVYYISIKLHVSLCIYNLQDTLVLQGGVSLIYGVDIVNKNVFAQDIPLIIFLLPLSTI